MSNEVSTAPETDDVHYMDYAEQIPKDRLTQMEKRLALLEALFKEHLRATRQACLQEVGFLEAAMGTEPRTKELRDKSRLEATMERESRIAELRAKSLDDGG